jgi:3-oxoacyl-(acyl-carrier-protein) synthase
MDRVLVTGLGVVSCLGTTTDSYWAGLLDARSEPAPVDDPLANMQNRLLYGIHGFPDPPVRHSIGRLGRTSAFALTAARAALADAALDESDLTGAGVGIGTGVGDVSLFESVPAGAPAPSGPDAYPFKVSSVLAAELGCAGPVVSVSTACSASVYSVSLAAQLIRDGEADVMVAGGADGYTRVGVACFNRMGALDPVRCLPFDAGRRGTVFGEGAALMVLESEEHARRRGHTRAYAAIEGSGWSCDGHHPTAPDAQAVQIVRAMREALAQADVGPDDLGCVVPHGTGTPLNDVVESLALGTALGNVAASVPVYSLKALLGHTGGAAGAFALLTAAMIIDRQLVPPNVELDLLDPECALRLHTGEPLPAVVNHALVNAYAFGGNNISMVIGRP